MKNQTAKTLKFSVMATLAVFALCGCFTGCNSYDDGSYRYNGGESISSVIRYEGDNMSTVLNDTASDSVLASGDTVADSVTGERVVVRLHHDATCQCFVRASLFTDRIGFTTQSQDTILLDSDGVRLGQFHPGNADTIVQVRYITQISSDTTEKLSLLFSTTLTKVTSGDTAVYDWGGAITGSLNGSALTPRSFNLVRTFTAGRFEFPCAGNSRSGSRYGYHGY